MAKRTPQQQGMSEEAGRRLRDTIRAGAIFISTNSDSDVPVRRVLGVVGWHVVYSTGGDRNRRCLLTTFTRWARGARVLRTGD